MTCRGRMPCRSPSPRTATAGRSRRPRPVPPGTPTSRPARTFRLERTFGERGDLLDREGKPLMPLGTVHAVQIDPVNATPEAAAELETIVGATKGSLTQALAKATASGSKAPIPVITYRDADWAPRADRIEDLKGVIAPTSEQPLARTRTFAQPLLGSFGEVTAEMVTDSGGRYAGGRPRRPQRAAGAVRRDAGRREPASGSRRAATGARRCSRRPPPTARTSRPPSTPPCRRPPRRPSPTAT